MHNRLKVLLLATLSLATLNVARISHAQSTAPAPSMSFFVTSVGLGDGANLGGLSGADKHCQDLAKTAGAGGKTWRAYLSTPATGKNKAINARDRIGKGPWYNAKGDMIATDIDQLHRDNNLNKQTALSEKGETINGRGDQPNRHDMLTGSDGYGMAFSGKEDTSCGGWTKNSGGSAQVGHHDRIGLNDKPPAKSWNHSHPSRGCSQDELKSSGGNGLYYCFATK